METLQKPEKGGSCVVEPGLGMNFAVGPRRQVFKILTDFPVGGVGLDFTRPLLCGVC